MTVHKISENLTQFFFAPEQHHSFGINVFMIQNNKHVILIDSGYRDHGKLVSRYLKEMNLDLDILLITHFHEDHISGIPELQPKKVYGHHRFKESLKNWVPEIEKKTCFLQKRLKINYRLHSAQMI